MADDVKAVAEALRRFHNTSLAFSSELHARAVIKTLKSLGWSPPNPDHDRELLNDAAEALDALLGWESAAPIAVQDHARVTLARLLPIINQRNPI